MGFRYPEKSQNFNRNYYNTSPVRGKEIKKSWLINQL